MRIRDLLAERPMTSAEVCDALGLDPGDFHGRLAVRRELEGAADRGLCEQAVLWRLKEDG